MRTLLTATALAAGLAAPAVAESWTYAVSPYLWLSGLDTSASTPRGDFNLSMSPSDVLSELDVGFMGVAEARNGPWSLILDFIYSDLSESRDFAPGAPYASATVSNQLTAATLYAGYRVHAGRTSVDLLAGARYYDLDFRLSAAAGTAPGFSLPSGSSWTDPVVGLRLRHDFNDRWFGTVVADFGGFSGDSDTWQAFTSLGYNLGPRWSLQGGWRHMSISKDMGAVDLDIDMSGLLLGATYRF